MMFFIPFVTFAETNQTLLKSMADSEFQQFIVQETPDIDSDKKIMAEQAKQNEKEIKASNHLSSPLKIAIKTAHNEKLVLYNVYRPENKENTLHVIYLMHGGGYMLDKAN